MRCDGFTGVDSGGQVLVCELSNAELSCYQAAGLVWQAGTLQGKGYFKGPRKSTVMSTISSFRCAPYWTARGSGKRGAVA